MGSENHRLKPALLQAAKRSESGFEDFDGGALACDFLADTDRIASWRLRNRYRLGRQAEKRSLQNASAILSLGRNFLQTATVSFCP
ncbi:MAG TPA: hypothetical protein VGR40_02455 [Candidatus Binatus sp.]|nr:hypothetical protein [Candidatus Binatus sp.]